MDFETNTKAEPYGGLTRGNGGGEIPSGQVESCRYAENSAALSPEEAGRPHLVHDVCVELVEDIATLKNFESEWTDLTANALEHNILLGPSLVLAALENLQDGQSVRFALIWQQPDPQSELKRKLIGFFPLTDFRHRWILPVRGAKAWQHLHSFLTTPLLDRSEARMAAEGFFRWLENEPAMPRFLLFQFMGRGKVWDIFNQVFSGNLTPMVEYDRRERAMLKTDLEGEDYLRKSLGAKRNKEYRRLRNRLQDHGEVNVRYTGDPEKIADASTRFLELEARGWKGNRGSALGSNTGEQKFFSNGLGGLAITGNCQVGELMVGEKVVASVVVISSGRTAWMWKITYDEDYSRFSPGVLLVLDLTKTLLAGKEFDFIDSCAMPNHPMINNIWRERFPFTDVLITARPGLVPKKLVSTLERLRRSSRARLKTFFNGYIRR